MDPQSGNQPGDSGQTFYGLLGPYKLWSPILSDWSFPGDPWLSILMFSNSWKAGYGRGVPARTAFHKGASSYFTDQILLTLL